MVKFILKRCLWMVVVLLATAFVIFTILYFTPGDPANIMLGGAATAEEIAQLHSQMGLDRPYLVQLGEFLYRSFVKFDFGKSWVFDVPVFEELTNRLPRTLTIGLCAMALNLTLGLILGIFAGTHQNRWQDSLTMAIAMIFVSTPDFWIALMMIVLFALKLGWLPAYGIGGPQYFIMPIICASLGGIATNSRQTRSSILEVSREDFITTARSKGQSERVVVRKHMLPNALMPVITTIGTGFARVVAGSAVIESVFSIPGVGLYMLNAIGNRDYPALRGSILFFAAFTVVVMLLVDLVYAYIDPRIKAQYTGKR
jgi:ABC-type dipeptide/oligopeptide/nickel transport system permease component